MAIVLSHPTGNSNVRAILTSLVEAGMLAKFNTTIAVNHDSRLLHLLPRYVRDELMRRTFPIPSKFIATRPLLESARMLSMRARLNWFTKNEHGCASVDAVYRDLDKATSRDLRKWITACNVSAVYAYEDGALQTFLKAKELGLQCIYDLPIAFWETGRRLMLEEAERLPRWANTLGGGVNDSIAKLERKTKELELADIIVTPGQFVADSLPDWTKDKKKVISPFGSPKIIKYEQAEVEFEKRRVHRPLRVLFVGSMGQRKGLGDLFNAIRLLNTSHLELVVLGSMLAPLSFYRSELSNFTYESGRSYERVLKLMRSCDVFCLPSIVEGRALVMQEAMSQALPLIITSNTGGEDLIKEGQTGFLIPIRSAEAIAEKINWFLEHKSEIIVMGKMAQEHAEKYTWENYGADIVKAISFLN
jgi:glycosyltransferase involved in cell wall biosynthesis